MIGGGSTEEDELEDGMAGCGLLGWVTFLSSADRTQEVEEARGQYLLLFRNRQRLDRFVIGFFEKLFVRSPPLPNNRTPPFVVAVC